MYQYIAKRVLLVIPTLIGAAALVFILMRLIPGDICVVRLGSGGGSFDPRAVDLCHAELGLNRPLIIQFLDFVWGFCHFDFGISMWSGKPVALEIVTRTRNSEQLSLGVSPRGTLMLQRAAQARAFLDGRDFCLPDDFKQLAVAVFSHRVVASSRHASLQKKSETTEAVLRDIVESVRIPL